MVLYQIHSVYAYNPGSLKEGGNTIIGLPEEAKYGMTREQIFEAYKQLQDKRCKTLWYPHNGCI